MRKILAVVVVLAVIAAGVWWFTGGNKGTGPLGGAAGGIAADAPLDFAPADTPYVFANIAPLPEAERARWVQQMEAATVMWRHQLDTMKKALGTDETPEAKRALAWMAAIEAEFAGKTADEGIALIGGKLDAVGALYGVGLAPVMRSELGDPAAFRATVERVAQRAGETLPTAKIDAVDYWYFPIPSTTLRIVVALQANHLVITVAPTDDAALRTLLGIDRPASTLRDSGALQALNAKFGYSPIGSGYVDTARIADILVTPSTPLETALLGAVGIERPTLDAACKPEAQRLASLVPRLSAGYTRLEAGHMDMASRIETLPAIAADLQSLRTPMPGPRSAPDAVLDVGFGLNIGGLPAVLNRWADQAQAHTFACPQLLPLNDTANQLRTLGSNAGIYTVAPMFSALRVLVARADIESFMAGSPDASGKVLIASGNPAALLSMAKNFSPELASFDLKPDGQVLAVPQVDANPLPLPAFAAMSPQVLALGVGADQQATLGEGLTLDPAFQPMLLYGFDGAFYGQIISFSMAQAALLAQTDEERAEAEQMAQMMRDSYGKMIKRAELSVDVDAHGLVFEQKAMTP